MPSDGVFQVEGLVEACLTPLFLWQIAIQRCPHVIPRKSFSEGRRGI
ncbi:MAG: hypothetical protein ABID84_04265 [Chloroflexota bacterium]